MRTSSPTCPLPPLYSPPAPLVSRREHSPHRGEGSFHSKARFVFTSLALTACLIGSMLAWAPDAAATAYPDVPITPVCTEGAPATVFIDGGDVTNTTTLDLSADGGTAVGDASGGDENLATTDDKDRDEKNGKKKQSKKRREDDADLAAAGNGGVADAGARGGAIAVENVNSGGNVGSDRDRQRRRRHRDRRCLGRRSEYRLGGRPCREWWLDH